MAIAMVWSQFAAYHIDRCEAVARRLGARADLRSIEMASASHDYAWEPSGDHAAIGKVTLFPSRHYEDVPAAAKFRALREAVKGCDWVFVGLSYAEPWVVILTWWLRFRGVRLVLFSESKADDRPRRPVVEWAKRIALGSYVGAIVGARRHVAYFRSLGFGRRFVLPGYDTVGVKRIRDLAGELKVAFTDRPFVFVGRFVAKKNLLALLEGYARYVQAAGSEVRRLVLAGSGECEPAIRRRAEELGIDHLVDLPGFLSANEVPPLLARSLALVLVSHEEQWGLVVNEALAVGLPVIVSPQVGSRDALVRQGENGFVVEPSQPTEIAAAMLCLAQNEGKWLHMAGASGTRAWMGDAERLADAVEVALGLPASPASRLADFVQEVV